MARLDFSLVWLGLFWFGLFSCLKKNGGETTGVEKIVRKKPSRGKP